MDPFPSSIFSLPDRLARKTEPTLVETDERHLAAIARSLEESTATLSARLAEQRKVVAGDGPDALERDDEIRHLTARLRTLRRYGVDLCLGRMVLAGRSEPVYVGRLGLGDGSGRRLLVDWRSPAAEPFFAATHAHPMGLLSRRRYRWTRGHITDYWDEVFATDTGTPPEALDDQSAFIASLGASRTPHMRDVLGTIAADQDAIIRAPSAGALVVDGGPGTGKTVVALHRAAYLLYTDPRLGHRRGGLLVIGPHEPYLAYVADVLPSLGEEGVLTCTLRDLVPEGAQASTEDDPEIVRLKGTAELVRAIEKAVAFYEEPPTEDLIVATDWGDLRLTADDWAEAFDAVEPGTPHNSARETVWQALVQILLDAYEGDAPVDAVRAQLERDEELAAALSRSWPLIDAAQLVADLWSVPAYLRMCAPWLTRDEVHALQRVDARAWTSSDLPLLDAARRRLGDPDEPRRQRARRRALAAQRQRMSDVVEDLISADDSELLVMRMLRGADLREVLVDDSGVRAAAPDPLAGPFAHVIVDEAQELTDAEWQMVLTRCPSLSLTIVGDRAQARHGFTESWPERLRGAGLDGVRVRTLGINYRTPTEVMEEAAPVITALLPDANVPASVRSTGQPVVHAPRSALRSVVDGWLGAHEDGIGCVIGDPAFLGTDRIRSLTPQTAKGLEFDLVVLVDPERFGTGIEGAVDRYVAMTRATQQLVILTSDDARSLR
ncbi:RNA polymerase recycling motor ATPase HelR [Cumulibacter manganitolerans]|uniref:RNA polymerase recycling motor ATPase HelR n=1 Tax=Cumulibacter manganitolerans TaxID=1884992 RepID=UPI001295BE63|nr:RNA polymerase recycling motor ATPase HelR [Cumulibacter manganitolerans]